MPRLRAVGRAWRRNVGWKGTGLFLYLWLMVGFASGTLVLLGPARWVTGAVRGRGLGQGAEDAAMILVIVLFVAASFAAALYLTRLLLSYRARALKTGVVLGVTAVAATALWGWGNPALYASISGGGGTEETVALRSGARFLFGAYPDRERLAELKESGVTAVVSLQHPAVVPFEPEGIQKERAWASEVGLRFVHAPMLPWVSDNEEALETIRGLAREGEGTYYVHCGLGRDRVNVVRRMLERMGGTVLAAGSEAPEALTWADREGEGLGPMERGAPQRLADDVWLVPHPNEHELFGHMLAGQVAHVLLLLDPEDSTQVAWLEEATRRFEAYDLPFSRHPVPEGDSLAARAAAREARALPRPLTVIAPFTPPEGDTAVAAAFRRAWEASEGRPDAPTRTAP